LVKPDCTEVNHNVKYGYATRSVLSVISFLTSE